MSIIGFTQNLNNKVRCYNGVNINENDIITYESDNKIWYSRVKSILQATIRVENVDLYTENNNILFKLNSIVNNKTRNNLDITRKIYKLNNITYFNI